MSCELCSAGLVGFKRFFNLTSLRLIALYGLFQCCSHKKFVLFPIVSTEFSTKFQQSGGISNKLALGMLNFNIFFSNYELNIGFGFTFLASETRFLFLSTGDDSFTSGVDLGVGERSFDGSNVVCGERALSTEDETPTREQVCLSKFYRCFFIYNINNTSRYVRFFAHKCADSLRDQAGPIWLVVTLNP